MPRARLIALAILIASCGSSAPAVTRPAPVADVADDAWARACDEGPVRERLERFRQLDLQRARARGEARTITALEAWCPRGCEGVPIAPIDQDARAVALGAARRAIELCGERDAIALTTELVRFQTVAAIAPPASNAEHARLAAWLARWSEEAGLVFRVSGENDAWEIELPGGRDERALSYVFHADVVPVNDPPSVIASDAVPSGWTVAPFEAHVDAGRLYGRGTEDDKGPIAAGMVVLASLRDAGIAPEAGSIVLALGTAEEEDWEPMRRYAASAPRARHVVSVDASYPVVAAESGFVAWGLVVPAIDVRRSERRAVALDARAGLFLTQIPDQAELVVRPPRGIALDVWIERAREAARIELDARDQPAYRIDVDAIEREGEQVARIVAHGRSAHSSVPDEGLNAMWLLAGIAARLELAPGAIPSALAIVRGFFDGDDFGERLGVGYADDFMGALTSAATLLRASPEGVTLQVNMRRPRGQSTDEFRASLDAALERVRAEHPDVRAIDEVHVGEPHVADLEGELVPTLMAVWRTVRDEPAARPISIRGGTYARLFPGAVDFGPSLPGRRYAGHGADEFIELEALHATTLMLYDAALRLTGETD
ncbi:M20/M25/M40 family metallo-hydrolase [Sandaracinus amylolyticus]|uniref:M20/M25/M40 family metallo-hydrolase n=1 Tax=Sandaracinus amylolyticus TaxID=927083 RepID=UPI001F3BDEAB|nr:M20/M25/M40 family metallo-hydrolase [Sandaracinus amylolyticus]UJR80044.1 Xaa-His dipeptidase [Sandaracinus amylolyticus]